MRKDFWDNLGHDRDWGYDRRRGGRALSLVALVALVVQLSGYRAVALGIPTGAHGQATDTAAAALQNGGFETRDLTGWTASSTDLVTVVSTHTAPNNNYVYDPVEGGWFARLEASEPDVYTTLAQNFSAQAGDVLSCWAFFDGEDILDWNDTGDVRILVGSDEVAVVYHADIASAGEQGYLPWSQWAYTVTVAGTYTLEARIANKKDNTMPSYLGLDGCRFGESAPNMAFNATSAGGRVALTWGTISETDTTGFNLYRATARDGSYDQLNAALIPAKGSGGANSYSYDDFPGAGVFFYKLETVAASGATQPQGPVQVQSTSPFRRPPRQPVPPQ